MFAIYWLINQDKTRTYVGLSEKLQERLKEHKNKKVFSTKNFGEFKAYILEEVNGDIAYARKREKYWKSNAGRKKLKNFYNKVNMARSPALPARQV